MRRLILVRHAEAEHHIGDLTGGWTDSALTPFGRQQAKATGEALVARGIDASTRLQSSDLLRARETSDVIAEQTGQKAEYHLDLRELNNGVAANKTVEEARRLSLPMTEPAIDWVPYPEAESWRMMSVRVMTFLDCVAADDEVETLLLVSHGNALIAAVHWWLRLGEDYWTSVSYDFNCGSITELSVNQWGERTISELNDTSHLPDGETLEQRHAPDALSRAGDA